MQNAVRHVRTGGKLALTSSTERVLLSTLSILVPLLIWEVLARTGLIHSRFLVPPSAVISEGWGQIHTAKFWSDCWVSVREFLLGYLFACLIAVPGGVVLGSTRWLLHLCEPLINFIYALPSLALLPVIFLQFGLTTKSKVIVVMISAGIVILVNTCQGVHTVEPEYLRVARAFNASRRRRYVSVVLPGSIPFILAGLRLGVGRGLIAVVAAELYSATAGLGFEISVASNNLYIAKVLFDTGVFVAIGLLTVHLLRRTERRFAPWRRAVATNQ
jgi:NitT/TauT family transport system permease protein